MFAYGHCTAWLGGQMNKSLLDRSSQALFSVLTMLWYTEPAALAWLS